MLGIHLGRRRSEAITVFMHRKSQGADVRARNRGSKVTATFGVTRSS